MKPSKLSIPVLSKDEFQTLLLEHLIEDKKHWSVNEVLAELLREGFPKLDFEILNTCLPKIFVYLPTVAVDIGDSKFVWVVSGNHAILVEKKPFEKP